MDVTDDMADSATRFCCVEEVGDSGGNAATEARATMDRASDVKGQGRSEFGEHPLDAQLSGRGTALKMRDLQHYEDRVADQVRIGGSKIGLIQLKNEVAK